MNLDEFIEKLQALELEVGSNVPVYVVDFCSGVSYSVTCASSRKVDRESFEGDLLDLESDKTYIEIGV